jgi:predicted ABC-type ATPase
MSKPTLWLIAGPNGAGKSTIVGQTRHILPNLVPNVSFINPDEHAKQALLRKGKQGFSDTSLAEQKAAFIEAAIELERYIESILLRGGTVGVETVLSTNKYKRFVEIVVEKGGTFGLIYVALNSPEIACKRVANRVSKGGHDVPKQKIRERWMRSLANLPWFLKRANYAFIFDNSSSADMPPILLARKHDGHLESTPEIAFPEIRPALKSER